MDTEPRVVTVSSMAHRAGSISFDDLSWERRRYMRWPAYGQSKLANLLFTLELARRAEEAGTDLVAAAAHPGYAATNLQTAGVGLGRAGPLLKPFMRIGNVIFGQSDAMGAPLRDGRRNDMTHPVVWFEVMGDDSARLQSFYRGLFGWKIDASNPMKYGMVEAASGRGIPGGACCAGKAADSL